MKLENETRYPALLFRGAVDEERLFGAVFARITYELRPDGDLVPTEEQTWDVSTGPWESEYGDMDSDEVFYREGVDLFVFGSARPPAGERVTSMEISVRVGERFRHTLHVFGERRWVRQDDRLVPSEPAPIEEVPLTLDNAFGGSDTWDGLDVAYPDNPDGKGFYLEEDSALDGPLPNLEDPDDRISRWDDRPEPAGTGATTIQFGPRVRRGVEFDDETGRLSKLKPRFFNAAFPGMIVPELGPGDVVEVGGVRSEGTLRVRIPPHRLFTRLRFGDATTEKELYVDQVGIEPDEDRVFIAYRYPFRYRLVELQERSCSLHDSEDGRDTSTETRESPT